MMVNGNGLEVWWDMMGVFMSSVSGSDDHSYRCATFGLIIGMSEKITET